MVDDQFVKGLDALISELKDLPANIEKNALRTSVFKAAQFMRDKVKEAAPARTGKLKASIKAKRSRGSREEVAAGVTGSFVARWVEKGHTLKSHGRSKGSRQIVGHVPANPFILRAFEANQEGALAIARKAIVEAIGKQIAKLRAKMPKI